METNLRQHIDGILHASQKAFLEYSLLSAARRSEFVEAIAQNISALGDALLFAAAGETNLGVERLRSERARTISQLRLYADAAAKGIVHDIRIDTEDKSRNPAKPDLRKISLPLGPVVVFGASNFPFAYSTAGGDTASALAAGCSVVMKGHPAHPRTSNMVAAAIEKAAKDTGMPEGVFLHVEGTSNEIGQELVMHPLTSAVAFTGSLNGGRVLYDLAATRTHPIPVFAEMGSLNPVFLFPSALKNNLQSIVEALASSITTGAGQFCTKPGLIIGVEGDEFSEFIELLSMEVEKVGPSPMLHKNIAATYLHERSMVLEQDGVDSYLQDIEDEGSPFVASVHVMEFLDNKNLQREVFGPFSLIIRCSAVDDFIQIVERLEGQLTTSLFISEEAASQITGFIEMVSRICGRIIFNGVPTGVDVAYAMQHGGPYPATTDPRFTSVGPDAIKRFLRPVSFQNCPQHLLPAELKDDNPLNVMRLVNGMLTTMHIRS